MVTQVGSLNLTRTWAWESALAPVSQVRKPTLLREVEPLAQGDLAEQHQNRSEVRYADPTVQALSTLPPGKLSQEKD